MTEMDLNERTVVRLRRWRRLSSLVTGSLAVAAVGAAVYLGATGPLVSPVQPAQPAVVAETVTDAGPGVTVGDANSPGPDRSPRGGRGDAVGFGRNR
jgi:hypothetical protein